LYLQHENDEGYHEPCLAQLPLGRCLKKESALINRVVIGSHIMTTEKQQQRAPPPDLNTHTKKKKKINEMVILTAVIKRDP